MTSPATNSPARWSTGGNLLYVVLMVVLAGLAAWPIYQSLQFVISVTVATAAGASIALLSHARRWSGWITAALVLGVFTVLGVPVAVPSALGGFGQLIAGFGQLFAGIVVGWKELVTISIPVGSYQATLVPVFVLFLVGSTVASASSLAREHRYLFAVPVLFVMQGFGLVFGSSLASAPMTVFGTVIGSPRELAVGLGAFAITVVWLIWRSWLARTAAISAAQRASGIRHVSHGRASTVRRVTLAASMLLIATIAAVAVTPALAAGQTRDVLRSAVDPDVKLRTELSPLSLYRSYYTDALFTESLFSITGGEGVDRLRLATLSDYDGRVFRVGAGDLGAGDQSSSFTRVPYTLVPPSSTGDRANLSVAIAGYRGVWVPTAGDLVSIDFAGKRPQALADGFFYNQSLESGIQLADQGLIEGDTYSITAQIPQGVALTDLAPIGQEPSDADAAVIPSSLVDWVDQQDVSADARGLQVLIDRLRARGYLSHSLAASGGDAQSAWINALEPYAFEPSRPGHSTDRIGELFSALTKKESEVGGDDDSLLVAAVGDDEQFATAAALLARQLGFHSRVVLGVHLSADSEASGALACADSGCTGSNIAAWIEVQGADGRWATVDVSPQHANPVSPDINLQRDPQVPTDVQQVTAQTVLPAQGQPGDGSTTTDDQEDGPNLTWLWTSLRIIATVLIVALIVTGPLLVVVAAKAVRRRARRRIENPLHRITAGWDEYVDTALDYGKPALHNPTRTQVAETYSSPQALALADTADRAVFGGEAPGTHESDEFWQIVDAERMRFAEGLTWRARARATISLRSFTHKLDLKSLLTTGRR